MLKQILALIVLSALVIVSASYTQDLVHALMRAHDWVSHLLTNVFSAGQAGHLLRGLFSLLAIPLLAAIIPATVYWMMRRHWFPYFMQVVWAVWLVQAGAIAVMYKVAIGG